jgi:hypothetical protein
MGAISMRPIGHGGLTSFLIGLAVAAPLAGLAVWFAIAHWKIALAGGVVVLILVAAAVSAVIAAIPIGYVIAAIYYATRPTQPGACTSYSIDQGREAGAPERGGPDR